MGFYFGALAGLVLWNLGPMQETNGRPENVLTAKAMPATVTIAPGAKKTLIVQLTVQRPYHVNANPASEVYLIPTSVNLGQPKDVMVGKLQYPKGTLKKFEFSPKPLSVYQDIVTVNVPLTVSSKAASGGHLISGTVKYQACSDAVCLPPATAKFSFTVQVANHHK